MADGLRQAARLLHNVASHISTAASLAERLESAGIELQDILEEMERTAQRVEYDPARLDFVQSRLDTLYSLMQKHHVQDVQSLVELRESLGERLNQLTNLDDDLAALEKHYDARVDYATVYVSLREVARLSNVEEPATGFGAQLAAAFSSGWKHFVSGVQDLAVALAYGWMWVLAAVVLVVLAVRKLKKKKPALPKLHKKEDQQE